MAVDATPTQPSSEPPIVLRRRTIDVVLIGVGALVAVVLLVAGGLLTWGHNFATDYVHDELVSQRISFPTADELTGEGRSDLVGHAGEQISTGSGAQAYASYIGGHLQKIADGATYADLGTPETAAKAAVKAAQDAGQPQASIDGLQAKADAITAQRNSLFKGETLRGLLLTAYAWATVGRIAGIAAICAFVAAGLMLALVVLGLIHHRRSARRIPART